MAILHTRIVWFWGAVVHVGLTGARTMRKRGGLDGKGDDSFLRVRFIASNENTATIMQMQYTALCTQ